MMRSWWMSALATLALAASLRPAAAQSGVQVGVLECRGSGSISFVIGPVHEFTCIFNPGGGPVVPYHGIVRKVGLDLGVIEGSVLGWAVFAPTRDIGPGDLAGNYGGVTAGAAVGVGGNANMLVGGSNSSIALQPLSLQGQAGLNLAVGVAALELHYGSNRTCRSPASGSPTGFTVRHTEKTLTASVVFAAGSLLLRLTIQLSLMPE
jgi:hypothetical protein